MLRQVVSLWFVWWLRMSVSERWRKCHLMTLPLQLPETCPVLSHPLPQAVDGHQLIQLSWKLPFHWHAWSVFFRYMLFLVMLVQQPPRIKSWLQNSSPKIHANNRLPKCMQMHFSRLVMKSVLRRGLPGLNKRGTSFRSIALLNHLINSHNLLTKNWSFKMIWFKLLSLPT